MNFTLTQVDYGALSPLLILLAGALILLLIEAFAPQASKRACLWVTLVTLFCALHASIYGPISNNPLLTPWLKFDAVSNFFTVLFIVIGIACTLLASSFFKQYEATEGEYFFLLLACVFGLILIGQSADFLTLFLGLETLSISLYILCGYMKSWRISHEASLKYFLMGALAAAFLLYGIALVYGAIGTTNFDALLPSYQKLATTQDTALFLSGIALITLGLAFKAAIVPFHIWAPDVYEGASSPVTAFMAVGTKAGAFAALTRVFLVALPDFNPMWNECAALLAYPTLIYANIVAIQQKQLRRFFAYSGISHAGFLLIPFAAGTQDALPSLEFYLVVYSLATLGAFAVLAFLDHGKEGVMVNDLRGLFHRSPLLAGLLSLCLLTLAGIPPTAGFFAKFYLFKVAFQAGYYALVVVGLLTAILSAFYYLRMVGVMLAEGPVVAHKPINTWSAGIVGAVSFAAIVFLSFYPAPLQTIISLASR